MAHQVEPMDIDNSVCDFDDKENSFHYSNVQPRTPSTEKGYEELDVSELNMKLRYSVTPSASPMSKSYTANCIDNGKEDNEMTYDFENGNMTRSLHSTLTKNDTLSKNETLTKSPKLLPLQALSTDNSQIDGNRNALRPLDTTITSENITITVSVPHDVDDNLSLPSSSSSMAHTPEATTPTNDILKSEGSPIMRGLKSVFSMFRPSQSHIPSAVDDVIKSEAISPPIVISPDSSEINQQQAVSASTPLTANKTKEPLKRITPVRDSLVFNDDLEKELEWKDDSSIIFGKEKVPIHKLFFQLPKSETKINPDVTKPLEANKCSGTVDTSVEYMDISYNDSVNNKTGTKASEFLNNSDTRVIESDGEFVDAESTFKSESQFEESFKSQNNETLPVQDPAENEDTVDLKQDLNASAGTLNASVSKSDDLSTASTDTIKQISTSTDVEAVKYKCEGDIDDGDDKEKPIEDKKTYGAVSPLEHVVSDNVVESNARSILLKTMPVLVSKSDSGLVDKQVIVHPITNNAGVNSLAQVPLIADPRVLLFNVSSVHENSGNEEDCNALQIKNASPADIPLPDDDDIASLPSMNCALDTIHHTLDIISDEIPKINEHKILDTTNERISESPDNILQIKENTQANDIIIPITNFENLPVQLSDSTIIDDNVNVNIMKAQTKTDSIRNVPDNNSPETKESSNLQPIDESLAEFAQPDSSKKAVKNYDASNVEHYFPIATNKDEMVPLKDVDISADPKVNFHVSQNYSTNCTPDASENAIKSFIPSDTEFIKNEIENIIHNAVEIVSTKIENSTFVCLNKANQVTISDEAKDFKAKDDQENTDVINNKPTEHTSSLCIFENDVNVSQDCAAEIKPSELLLGVEGKGAKKHVNDDENSQKNNFHEVTSNVILPVIDHAAQSKQNLIENLVQESENFYSMKKEPCVIIDSRPEDEIVSVENSEIEYNVPRQNNEVIIASKIEEVNENMKSKLSKESGKNLFINSSDHIGMELVSKLSGQETMVVKQGSTTEKESNVPQDSNETMHIDSTPIELKKVDEEVVVSKNDSPFVLIPRENEGDFETIPKCSKKVITPPSSPKVLSKGYNINFDEIENPFATNSRVRSSPPLVLSPDSSFNTMKSTNAENKFSSETPLNNTAYEKHPEHFKKLNSSITDKHIEDTPSVFEETKQIQDLDAGTKLSTETFTNEMKILTEEMYSKNKEKERYDNINTTGYVNKVLNENEMTSSLEQTSTYSTATCSNEYLDPKNTNFSSFDDSNINQFVTTSKVCLSPPPENKEFNPFATINRICQTPPPNNTSDGNGIIKSNETFDTLKAPDTERQLLKTTEDGEKIVSVNKNNLNPVEDNDNDNLSFVTMPSKNEKDVSTETVNTEDEDTIEGPFLEAEDFISDDKMSDYDVENEIVQFSEVPLGQEENIEGGEMFIDAEAFEFLLNQNKNNAVTDSGKESLFLKFDPLFAKRISSDGVLAALKQAPTKQSSPKKMERQSISKKSVLHKSPVVSSKPSSTKTIEKRPRLKDVTFDKSHFDESTKNSPEDFSNPMLQKNATFDISSVMEPTQRTPESVEKPLIPKDATFDTSPFTDKIITVTLQSTTNNSEKPILVKDSTFDKSPIPGPSQIDTTQDIDTLDTTEESCDELNVTVSKPMMVVNPAVNPVVTPRNKSLTPVRSNRQSLTFTSPAIAVIDRLLSMSSSNNSFMAHDTTVAEVRRDNEADLALTQLRELLADKEISVYNLRTETKELRDRLANMESQMKTLESVAEERLMKINQLYEKLDEKSKINKSMAKVVEEYERTIASLIAETEQDRKRHAEERAQLIKERDEQTAHLASMEISFNDLHSKYEKSKQVILGFKANEDMYKKSNKEFEENLAKMQKNYELLKQHATSKLNYANEELQKINRAHEAEVLKFNALIKRKELHITSLEETLQQKTKANEELTAICDELINKVG